MTTISSTLPIFGYPGAIELSNQDAAGNQQFSKVLAETGTGATTEEISSETANNFDGSVDPRVLAWEQRVEALHDPKIVVFDQVLTSDDKAMLSRLNGGSWRQVGPAQLLVAEVALARANGTLSGPISADFIQGIMAGQQASDQFNPYQIEIPQSVLMGALDWINGHNPRAGSRS